MAFPATIRLSSAKFPSQFQLLSFEPSKPYLYKKSLTFKRFRVNASTSIGSSSVTVADKPSTIKKVIFVSGKPFFAVKLIKLCYIFVHFMIAVDFFFVGFCGFNL